MLVQEQLFILITDTPQTLKKYTLGYDDVIQAGVTKNIFFYPFSAVFAGQMWPNIYYTNNKVFNVLQPLDISNIVLGFGDRDGGYFCQEYNLAGFLKPFAFKKNYHFHTKIDFSRSYYRVLNAATLVTPLPILIPLYFELHS